MPLISIFNLIRRDTLGMVVSILRGYGSRSTTKTVSLDQQNNSVWKKGNITRIISFYVLRSEPHSRAFSRLISGYHGSTTTHICAHFSVQNTDVSIWSFLVVAFLFCSFSWRRWTRKVSQQQNGSQISASLWIDLLVSLIALKTYISLSCSYWGIDHAAFEFVSVLLTWHRRATNKASEYFLNYDYDTGRPEDDGQVRYTR